MRYLMPMEAGTRKYPEKNLVLKKKKFEEQLFFIIVGHVGANKQFINYGPIIIVFSNHFMLFYFILG